MNTEKTLVKGSPAPDFSLPSHDGKTIHLSDLRGQFVVLYFYPKDATPGCTTEACDFRDLWPSFGNAVVLGVSPDSLSSHEKFAAKYNLPFPLLSDAEAGVAKQYGAYGEKVLYGKKTVGMIRSTFVIGPDGTLAAVFRSVKVAGHAEKVRQTLVSLGASHETTAQA
jgi:peroxiredoxin Q/BCP